MSAASLRTFLSLHLIWIVCRTIILRTDGSALVWSKATSGRTLALGREFSTLAVHYQDDAVARQGRMF
jgi:hypothetical protein